MTAHVRASSRRIDRASSNDEALEDEAVAAADVRDAASAPSAPSSRGGSSLRRRALVSLLAFVVLVGLGFVPAPGLRLEAVPTEVRSAGLFSPFAIGILPLLAAQFLVEVWALVSSWKALRHAGSVARAPIDRWALRCALPLTFGWVLLFTNGVAANGLVRSGTPALLFACSLVAGCIVLWLLAAFAGRFGLVNGYALALLALVSRSTLPALLDVVRDVDGDAFLVPDRRHAFFVALLLAVVAIVVALVAPRRRAPGAPWVPIPSSSLLAAGGGLVAGLGSSNWGADSAPAVEPIAIAAVLAVMLTFALHAPGRVATIMRAADPSLSADAMRGRAWRATVLALVATIFFFSALILAERAAHTSLGAARLGSIVELLALFIAVVLDAVFAVRLHARMPDAVNVWQERRSEAAFAIREALARAGIDAELSGVHVFSLFQFFAPAMPVEVHVPAAQADRARDWLAEFAARDSAEPAPVAAAAVGSSPAPVSAWLRVATLGVLAIGAVAVQSWAKVPVGAVGSPRPVRFELYYVDDRIDPFAAPSIALPAGGSLQSSSPVPTGLGADGTVMQRPEHWLRIVAGSGERPDTLLARAEFWAHGVALPEGVRVAWGRPVDPTTHLQMTEALRSYVLVGAPILTNGDVAEATVNADTSMPDKQYYVTLTLTEAARQRFADATAGWVKRRIAIVRDGLVESAPVVQSKIAGGHVSVTLGSMPPKQQLQAARDLALALDPPH